MALHDKSLSANLNCARPKEVAVQQVACAAVAKGAWSNPAGTSGSLSLEIEQATCTAISYQANRGNK